MHNKHAVFLRGHQRVWMYSNTNIFNAVQAIFGDNVDWYVAMWNSNSTDYNKILKTFDGKNLMHLELLDQTDLPIPANRRLKENLERPDDTNTDMCHPHWNLAFLDQVLNAKKCEYELKNGTIYDRVMFTRPDVAFIIEDLNPVVLEDFECAGDSHGCFTHDYDVFMGDLFYICTSITADIMASRFLNTSITNPVKQFITPAAHTFLAQYCQNNHLILKKYEGVIPFIIRPNTLYMLSKSDYTDEDRIAWETWGALDYDIRMKSITDLGIDPAEYI